MNRALVIGSQIEGLRGVGNDTAAIKAWLEAHDFTVDLRTDRLATRAKILEGYEDLIAACGHDDAAVIYYSGHGFYGALPGKDRTWQCIAPTDVREGGERDFRGITSWELSILQERLTSKTKNVTVILDCCHASQMSRDGIVRDATPRALPHPVKVGVAAHLDALRAKYGSAFDEVDAVGNPHAVRLVACTEVESAFEYYTDANQYRGAFTEALLGVLDEVGDATVTWSAISGAIRARVMRYFATQQPEVEGPSQRRLFSLVEDNDRGIVALRKVADRLELPGGALTGVLKGDIYGVMPVGSTSYDAVRAIAELTVADPKPLRAVMEVRAWHNRHTAIPVDAVAIPIVRNALRRAVELDAPAEHRATIARALEDTRTLRVTESQDETRTPQVAVPTDAAIAKLRLSAGQLTIEDPRGPLFPPAEYPGHLEETVRNVKNLGVAQAVRDLVGEHGVFRREVEIELGLVENGARRPLKDHRAPLGLKDRYYIRVKNVGRRQLFAHVFNIGLQGRVKLLTKDVAPAGLALQTGDPDWVLGQRADGELLGRGIAWPAGLPMTFPRVDEYFVVVTSSRVTLATLETQSHAISATKRSAGTKLQELLAQLHDGLTRDDSADEPLEGFLVTRLSYLLYPRDAALGGQVFEIDDNPSGQAALRDPSAWFARGGDAAASPLGVDAPNEIAIRLADLVVDKNRAVFATDVRVDALICTRAPDGQRGYTTWTQKYADIRSGQRLPLDNGLLFLGPVRDFVDITLFVARDVEDSLELAQLFAAQANSAEFKSAAGALLIAAGAAAVPWVAAVGATAALARMAYELVMKAAADRAIGLYRTSYLRHERFGVGRHPAESLYTAQHFSFSLLIESVELQRVDE